MGRALYLVINSRDRWWVDFEGRASGPFETIHQAAIEAQRQARNLQAAGGRVAEVLAPDAAGKYWVVWSSARQGASADAAISGLAAQ